MNAQPYVIAAEICFVIAAVLLLIIVPFMRLNAQAEYLAYEYCEVHKTTEYQTFWATHPR